MAENKTKPTAGSVDDYLTARAKGGQHDDCRWLMDLLGRATGQPPVMWGPSIVGYGSYHYVYESGRSGDAPLIGFAVRSREIVIYIDAEGEEQVSLLARLGKHRMGASCLYFKQLADLDLAALEKLVRNSVQSMRRRYGASRSC